MPRTCRNLILLALTLPVVSGCVVVDRYGDIDPIATNTANTLIGAAVVAGTVIYALDHDHHRHHRHHYRKSKHRRVRFCW